MFKLKKGIIKRAIFASTIFTNLSKYMEFASNSEIISVKFGGKQHEIESNTLIVSLLAISTILDEINAELTPEERITIKIKATKEGSFELMLGILITNVAKHIFSGEPLENLRIIRDTLVKIFNLKKLLGDKKPKSITQGEQNVVIEIDGDNNAPIFVDNRVYKIYQTPEVRTALKKTFEQIEREGEITDFEIGDGEKPLLNIPRSEFQDMATDVSLTEEETRTVVAENTKIEVRKVAFENRTWEFNYKGRKIKAKLNDDAFFEKVQKGEKFGKGDTLRVEMHIRQEVEENGLYLDKEFTVVRVLNHTSKENTTQDKLFGN